MRGLVAGGGARVEEDVGFAVVPPHPFSLAFPAAQGRRRETRGQVLNNDLAACDEKAT